ncbi:DUF6912 family protein [Haloechinothrix sp. LS1_15]|uniref:DUF6912 family protein n=1 Tax=Haloechinothrix sp. LS1_15 TaxID=2652248 RepID=UPI00294667E6|nr:hypothetical protein [Haloechinothrix sp. LS1_15]MDV6011579.1 hypothetical protein [Haloechinothrix sp. LS1_15]
MRVYVPATVGMLQELAEQQEISPVSGTAFAVTPALREFYTSGSTEELEYAAMQDAARASLRLLTGERDRATEDERPARRRAVISADIDDVTHRSDLDAAVVRIAGAIPLSKVAAVHVDTSEAEEAVEAAVDAIDAADLGDPDAELTLGDVEDHELAWYAPQELSLLLQLL